MEALAALAVACNVIELVGVGREAVTLCRQVYKDGSDVRSSALQETSKQLKSCLDDVLTKTHSGATISGSLKSLSEKCRATAKALQEELDALKVPAKSKITVVFGRVLKSMIKAKEIAELKRQLDEYEKVLDTRILVDLSKEVRSCNQSQSQAIAGLDQKIQSFAALITAGHTTVSDLIKSEFSQLRSDVKQEHTNTQQHVDNSIVTAFQTMSIAQVEKERRKQILDRLFFPEINRRQEEVKDAHRRTFEWIFDPPSKGQALRHSFVEWLQNDQQLYWIKGKPGSGKSTLMNFIVSDARTEDSLKQWSSPDACVVLTFFFWEAGTDLQKNSNGLLRSLLWQLLQRSSNLDGNLWSSVNLGSGAEIEAWIQKRLLMALLDALRNTASPICMFLDGLDEFEDEDFLLEFVEALQQVPNMKLCLSSRPSSLFEDFFQEHPRLQLQEFTKGDIELYIEEKLFLNPSWQKLKATEDDEWYIRGTLLEKAQGVFLWVDLVVKDLLRGCRKRDTIEYLMQRLDRMQDDIFALYRQMWDKNKADGPLYEQEAAVYLCLILEKEMDLLQFGVAIDEKMQMQFLDFQSQADIRRMRAHIDDEKPWIWVETRCAGLIEVTAKRSSDPYRASRFEPETLQVHFIHRTVREFLTQKEEGKSIIAACPCSKESIQCMLFRSGLVFEILSAVDTSSYVEFDPARRLLSAIPRDETYDYLIQEAERVLCKLANIGLIAFQKRSDWYERTLHSGSWRIKSFPECAEMSIDFSYIFACAGRFNYVQRNHATHADKRTLTELLCLSALLQVGDQEPVASAADFASYLVSRGADVDDTVMQSTHLGSETVLSFVLRQMLERRYLAPSSGHDVLPDLFEKLLSRAANPNAIILTSIEDFIYSGMIDADFSVLLKFSAWDLIRTEVCRNPSEYTPAFRTLVEAKATRCQQILLVYDKRELSRFQIGLQESAFLIKRGFDEADLWFRGTEWITCPIPSYHDYEFGARFVEAFSKIKARCKRVTTLAEAAVCLGWPEKDPEELSRLEVVAVKNLRKWGYISWDGNEDEDEETARKLARALIAIPLNSSSYQ